MSADLHIEPARGPSGHAILVCLALGALAATAYHVGIIDWLGWGAKTPTATKPAIDYCFFALAPLALYVFRRLAFICLSLWLLYQGTELAVAAGLIKASEALWAVVIGGFLILLATAPKLTKAEIEQEEHDHREWEKRQAMYAAHRQQDEINRRMTRHL